MGKQAGKRGTARQAITGEEMSDFELALWSLSFEEREMLKRYALYYWREYGSGQVQPKRAELSTEKGVESGSFHNPLPQIERDVVSSKRLKILVC